MKTIPEHTLQFLDSWLTLREKWAELPGFAVAIAKDGNVIFDKAYGYADVENQEKLTPQHAFRVASHTKTFTATAILQLQEQSKLRIDDRVVDYVPWLKDHTDARWQAVTLRQLLSHSAGVLRDGIDTRYWQLERPFLDKAGLQRTIMATDLVLEPNTRMKYSNLGYALLGLVVEAVSGAAYGEYITEHIIQSLDLRQTTPDYDMTAAVSQAYSRLTLMGKRFTAPLTKTTGALVSATGLYSTPADLCRFYSAQRVGVQGVLSDVSKREMQRWQWHIPKTKRGYGLGMDVDQMGGRALIGHGGGFLGSHSHTVCDVDDGLVVSVAINADGLRAKTVVEAIVGLIDEFGDEPPKAEECIYEGRFADAFGVNEIIAHAGGLRSIEPNSWWPLYSVTRLEAVDKTTLRICGASGLGNEGETMQFDFAPDGTIKEVIYADGPIIPSLDGDMIPRWQLNEASDKRRR